MIYTFNHNQTNIVILYGEIFVPSIYVLKGMRYLIDETYWIVNLEDFEELSKERDRLLSKEGALYFG